MKNSSDLNSQIEHYKMLNRETTRLRNEIRQEQLLLFKNAWNKFWNNKAIAITLSGFALLIFISSIAPTKTITAKQIITTRVVMINSDTLKLHKHFLNKLGEVESGNNYKCVNSLGYCGKYQMGKSALTEIGINVSREDFLDTPELQEIAITLLLKKNKQFLQNQIGKYNSKTIQGIYITESGLLAGAHLGGSGNVTRWLESNGKDDFKDGNGVPISRYIKEFSDYKLSL